VYGATANRVCTDPGSRGEAKIDLIRRQTESEAGDATIMKRFACQASIHFDYIVTAATKEEAEALLTEQLGPDWAGNLQPDDIDHPQIEQGACDTEINCLGEEGEA
jgi:hypothetical protein